jgi:Protein of unknown function (DUF3037)
VRERCAFDYAVVRWVPRVEREEFINVGVVVHAPARAFVSCQLVLDRQRLASFAPALPADELTEVARHIEAWRAVCQGDDAGGPIARLSPSERFHWLVAPRSTALQTSAVHTGMTDDPAAALARLFQVMVAATAAPPGSS